MWFAAPENDYRGLIGLADPEPDLRVAVCMPVYNRVDLLARTVAALIPQSYPRHLMEVVVGDDGSDEDVEAAVAPFRDRLRITVLRREHDGYGAGQARNLAARAATDAQVLVFVDSDCLPDEDLVSRHAAWHHHAENLVVIGSRHGLDTTDFDLDQLASGGAGLRTATFGTETPDGAAVRHTDHRRPLHRQTADQRHGDEAFRSLVSSNFSIRRDRFLDVGGFDETFKRWGFEDVELGWRCHVGGLFTVPEDRAIVYHQLQEDLWDPEGRRASMELNRGVVRNKIPHSFYRKHTPSHIWEVPKVSVVAVPVVPGRIAELADQVRAQSYTDWEFIVAGDSPEATFFAEENAADPRFRVLPGASALECVAAARGEYVALIHGDAALEPRALTELINRLDAKRRLSSASAAYTVGTDVHRDADDKALLDTAWDISTLGTPVFRVTRRRDWSKALHQAESLRAAIATLDHLGETHHSPSPMIRLRATQPDGSVGEPLPTFTNRTTRLRREVAAHGLGVGSVKAIGKYLLRPQPAPAQPKAKPARSAERRPVVRYVGWTGHENLGDEALLAAVEGLIDWGDVRTSKRGDLLLLGGGTLINRGSYLSWLEEHDSPRIERAVLGTGVANPEFWKNDANGARWVEWLRTCAYVGVRGPISAKVLDDWGLDRNVEVVGDAALLLTVDVAKRDGLVVVAPCRTRGELWGGSDEAVIDSLGATVAALLQRGHEVTMLAAHPDDDGPCLQVMRRAGAPGLDYLAGYESIDESLALLGSAELVVAERLHAAVLAASCGTAFVGLEYRPKVRDFAASVSMEGQVLRTDDLGGLQELVVASFEQRDRLVTEANVKVEEYRVRLAAASERLRTVMLR
jgi:glycosyltransferase involved in cell wall biosynthesis